MDSTFKSKFDQLLDVLERIISIIKPKTYNLLARVVVFLGAGLGRVRFGLQAAAKESIHSFDQERVLCESCGVCW